MRPEKKNAKRGKNWLQFTKEMTQPIDCRGFWIISEYDQQFPSSSVCFFFLLLERWSCKKASVFHVAIERYPNELFRYFFFAVVVVKARCKKSPEKYYNQYLWKGLNLVGKLEVEFLKVADRFCFLSQKWIYKGFLVVKDIHIYIYIFFFAK